MLGWKVKKIDGSWTEWGNLSDGDGDPTPGDATLPVGSQWALNNATYTDNLQQGDPLNSDKPKCTSGNPINCGRVACVDANDDIYNTVGVVAAPDQTSENDKQICATGTPLTDCNGNLN